MKRWAEERIKTIGDDFDKFVNEVHNKIRPRIVITVRPIEDITNIINDNIFLPDQIKTINTLREILLKSI
jgi:hypothetical protein